MKLVEVKIANTTLVLPCDEITTVSQLTAAALEEYKSFNKKIIPQRIICTKDSHGRVLSGILKIIEHGIDLSLEVLIEDYSTHNSGGNSASNSNSANSNDNRDGNSIDNNRGMSDRNNSRNNNSNSDNNYDSNIRNTPKLVEPDEIENLYREWQLWTSTQIYEYIYSLSIAEIPSKPKNETLLLLHELCNSPNEKVQLLCLRIMKIILIKFPYKQLVCLIANEICKLFSVTKHCSVAIKALEAFHNINPLQFSLFHGEKYIQNLFLSTTIADTLARFPTNRHSELFEKFLALAKLINDQEMLSIIRKYKKEHSYLSNSNGNGNSNSDDDNNSDGNDDDNSDGDNEKNNDLLRSDSDDNNSNSNYKNSHSPNKNNSNHTEKPKWKLNNTDNSENKSGEITNNTSNNANESATDTKEPSKTSAKRINLTRLESLLASDDQKIRLYSLEKLYKILYYATRTHLIHDMKHNISKKVITNNESIEKLNSEDDDSIRSNYYNFSFTTEKEVESIVKCLFNCLKKSINARANTEMKSKPKSRIHQTEDNNSNGKNEKMYDDDNGNGDNSKNRKRNKDGSNSSSNNINNDGKKVKSSAARLIQIALRSPACDYESVTIIVECLWLILHFPSDIKSITKRVKNKNFNITKNKLTKIQIVFGYSARDYYKLLLTLSHAEENNHDQTNSVLAEKCSFFFLLVHELMGNWKFSESKIDIETLHQFIMYLKVGRSNYRCYLGLHYLNYLSKLVLDNQSNTRNFDGIVNENDNSYMLKEITCWNNFILFKYLWQWLTEEKSTYQLRLLAAESVATVTVFSDLYEIVLTFDPIGTLLELLQRAVRNKEVEPDEFKCSIAHNSLVKGEEFDDLRTIIDGDDNSEDEDHGNLVEIEYDFDSSDNEDLEHINRRSTKSLDKNIVKQKAIPDIVLIRHALKILSNVMNIPMGIKDEHQMAYHEHLSTELSEIMVGDSSTTQGIPLTKIAKKDEYINFYYSMLSN